ncbi:hypothetical protein Q4E93_21405 [Flavitalea sp. BT771]|uniref:hypothetical protein n=1 Tax=Flavitalea sp. BT771 TaxID=3063329 RepID=UPI0026E34154|nr:hypothetical protein [Flavitalea sp. BT771]MDO6433181.1 hypothetical protein [Flavitalea sp. BT771]MDV6221543.1 hypothetical protein [Flavitalea sp. BT771]
MIEWLNLQPDTKRQILEEAATRTGLPPNAIEKDWWVTLTLQACFQTTYKDQLVFKGGTSLSNTQIKKLREKTAAFMATTFRDALDDTLQALGVSQEWYRLDIQPGGEADGTRRSWSCIIRRCSHRMAT